MGPVWKNPRHHQGVEWTSEQRQAQGPREIWSIAVQSWVPWGVPWLCFMENPGETQENPMNMIEHLDDFMARRFAEWMFLLALFVLFPSFSNGKSIAESSYSGCVISWLLLKQLQIMDWNQLEIWQRHIKNDIVVICCYRCFVNPRAFHFVQGILSSFYSCKTLAI